MKKARILVLLALALSSLAAFAQSRGLEVIAKALGGEHAIAGKQYAVFIAIDAYKEWLPLKNPVKDAREIRDILMSRYYIDQVLELYDGEATKSGVLRLFDSLIKTVKPEDSVLIYYAGHGQLDDTETGFWIPVDAGVDKFEQRNWIPNIQVRNNIGKMQARHVALVSDSCFSGDILNPTRGAAPTVDQAYFSKAWSRVSRQVLTSGASESVPDQSEFSRQLKLALQGNNQPYLDPLMLYGQIRLGMGRTTPLFGDLKDSGHQEGASFLLFLRGVGEASSASAARAAYGAPAAATADLSVSASMEGAEIYVDGVSYGKAPALAAGLPSGRPLKVSARFGAYSGSVDLSLGPKELREVTVKLERMKANLLIVSAAKEVSVFIDGEANGPLGSGAFRDLPAGEVLLELKGEGLYYRAKPSLKPEETLKLSAEPWAVGSIEYEAPEGVSLSFTGADGLGVKAMGSGRLENLAVGEYRAEAANLAPGLFVRRLSLRKGETAAFRVASGRLAFDWLPPKAVVTLDEKAIPLSYGQFSNCLSEPVFAQAYDLSVTMPGIGVFQDRVEVGSGADTRIEGLSSFALDALKGLERKRRSLDAGARVSLGIGLIGAAGAGLSYFLGAEAMGSYREARVTADIVAAKEEANAWSAVLVASAIAGGSGLALAPLLWKAGPDKKDLESSIRSLEAQLDALAKAGR